MILFVDDQPRAVHPYVEALVEKGHEVNLVEAPEEAFTRIERNREDIDCIVLDVMFPNDGSFSPAATEDGLLTGIPLFASMRSRFSEVPTVVLTNCLDPRVERYFMGQERCFFYRKAELLPRELVQLIDGVIGRDTDALMERLHSCIPGREDSMEYQEICASLLEYLFVPPMRKVEVQVARSDRHEIRDAVLEIDAVPGFWAGLQREFRANYVVFEFKNYKRPIGKQEVQQLRNYLHRRSVGRIGILLSRLPPSESALIERRDAYAEDNILILFLDDSILQRMVGLRRRGDDPALELRRQKRQFELEY